MSSKDLILQRVQAAAPKGRRLPDVEQPHNAASFDVVHKFTEVLNAIGGKVVLVPANQPVTDAVREVYGPQAPILSVSRYANFDALPDDAVNNPHLLQETEVALMDAQFGVAENGAVWLTENEYKVRALPFICTHLAVVLQRDALVPYMHHAYQRIDADSDYGFGLFIAGPSKTADIEQSLVLGAHGPKTMTVFLVG
jgi:L-lactate dehydrogenase complex protein LldG